MKKAILMGFWVAGFAAAPAMADQDLATAKGCMACHQLEVKVVGPAYKDVAAKYKSDAGAEGMLAGKIKTGGAGTWGPIPMPPNPTLSDGEAATLAKWILGM